MKLDHDTWCGAAELLVRRFQRRQGLAVDGRAGRATRAAFDAALGAPPPPPVRVDVVYAMFPGARRANVDRYLPAILAALTREWLDDEPMVRMALATIRAETAGFVPIDEGRSPFNTTPGRHPFNRYDDRADLGNQGRPDGERYKGRGFIQLTGRANYRTIGRLLELDLEARPELANEAEPAARILAAFLARHETSIRQAIAAGDLPKARRLVNGGRHGLDDFTTAWHTAAAAGGVLA